MLFSGVVEDDTEDKIDPDTGEKLISYVRLHLARHVELTDLLKSKLTESVTPNNNLNPDDYYLTDKFIQLF